MPPQDDIQYLIHTESISILERVIVWILTGDLAIQPTRLYKTLGLLDNSLRRGWPGIYQDVLDLDTFQVKVANWPMNGDQSYFSQIPALKKHYDMHTATIQQISLSCLVLSSKNTNTSAGCMEALRHVFKHFFIPEFRQFWIKNLEKHKRTILKQHDLPINWNGDEVFNALQADHPFSQR